MKFPIISVITMIFGAITVHSLQCYQCASTVSMDDCSSKAVRTVCPASTSVCANIEVKHESGGISVQAFAKGCTASEFCREEAIPACSQEGTQCSIECCSGDLCNDGGDGEEGSAVEGLLCHQCLSSTSMSDCIEKQTTEQCKAGWNKCGILEVHTPELTGFRKGCVTEQLCKTYCASGPSGEAEIDHCKLSCCEGNFCNSEDQSSIYSK